METKIILQAPSRDLAADVLDPETGHPKVMPASYYAGTSVAERAVFGNRNACYVLPTAELITWLREFIAGRKAIEIGAGNGVVAQALGIPATDNRMQEWPEIKEHYGALRQPVIRYGAAVEQLDAHAAVERYRPKVVIACWVTHRWDPVRPEAEGNMHGVDEEAIVRAVDNYVFVGNRRVHQHKPLWKLSHTLIEPPWLYSRAHNGSPDFIAVWGSAKPGD